MDSSGEPWDVSLEIADIHLPRSKRHLFDSATAALPMSPAFRQLQQSRLWAVYLFHSMAVARFFGDAVVLDMKLKKLVVKWSAIWLFLLVWRDVLQNVMQLVQDWPKQCLERNKLEPTESVTLRPAAHALRRCHHVALSRTQRNLWIPLDPHGRGTTLTWSRFWNLPKFPWLMNMNNDE